MSIRGQIMAALDTQLKTILKSNGYNTDIGEKVYQWKTTDTPDLDMPCIAHQDPACELVKPFEDNDNAEDPYHYKKLTVHIYFITVGSATPSDLRDMIEDVLMAIGEDVTFGDLAWDTTLSGDTTEIEEKNRKYGATRIEIFIEYKTLKWQD